MTSVEKFLLISGAIGAGKTSVANVLVSRFKFQKISSSGYLRSLIPPEELSVGDNARFQLQNLGDQLDKETDYFWVVDPVSTGQIKIHPDIHNWLIDAVRKKRQVEHFRNKFGSAIRHIHLTAPEEILRSRHSCRSDEYDRAVNHSNEVNARSLGEIADLIIDTSVNAPNVVATQIVSLWETHSA